MYRLGCMGDLLSSINLCRPGQVGSWDWERANMTVPHPSMRKHLTTRTLVLPSHITANRGKMGNKTSKWLMFDRRGRRTRPRGIEIRSRRRGWWRRGGGTGPSSCSRPGMGVTLSSYTRVLNTQHLYGIWTGLTPYRLPLDTLSEYPEPWFWKIPGSEWERTCQF